MATGNLRRAVFLDRDGVINVDTAYCSRIEDFRFVDGVLEAAKALYAAGWLLVVVTNQSGIGRGYYTEADFRRLTGWMKDVFEKAGAPLADVRFCPHHPDAAVPEYRCRCNCRKPAPGMILEAAETLGIDLTQSVMVGDKQGDMQAAKAAGIPHRIWSVPTAKPCPKPSPKPPIRPDRSPKPRRSFSGSQTFPASGARTNAHQTESVTIETNVWAVVTFATAAAFSRIDAVMT